jgi:tryptophanyl-tRNA synthetase
VSNLLTILAAFTDRDVHGLAKDYDGRGYGALKGDTAEAVVAFAEPFAARVAELVADPAELHRLMASGATKAREVAAVTVRTAYDRIGLVGTGR